LANTTHCQAIKAFFPQRTLQFVSCSILLKSTLDQFYKSLTLIYSKWRTYSIWCQILTQTGSLKKDNLGTSFEIFSLVTFSQTVTSQDKSFFFCILRGIEMQF
jgi:hypothetical protein